jgi:hypothetical protein
MPQLIVFEMTRIDGFSKYRFKNCDGELGGWNNYRLLDLVPATTYFDWPTQNLKLSNLKTSH